MPYGLMKLKGRRKENKEGRYDREIKECKTDQKKKVWRKYKTKKKINEENIIIQKGKRKRKKWGMNKNKRKRKKERELTNKI